MAYFYFIKEEEKNHSSLCAIVENSADQIYYVSSNNADIVEVSTEDFKKLQLGTHHLESYDGSNFVFREEAPANSPYPLEQRESEAIVQDSINARIESIQNWLEANVGHDKHTEWSDYKTYLENVNVASILPINKSWEKYCSDNSISFKNILELPHK